MKGDIKVVLVDDEQDGLLLLESMLNDIGGLQILGTAQSVDAAYDLVEKHRPDLLFLDIEMPVKDGFQLVQMLSSNDLLCDLIFVTAHNEYAIKAIKHAAFDYLLKPIDIDELKQALGRYRAQTKHQVIEDKIDLLLTSLSSERLIRINTRRGFLLIPHQNMLYLEAAGNYTNIYLTEGKKEVSTRNLGSLESLLPGAVFKRLGRSVIINIRYLYEVDRVKRICTLQSGSQVQSIELSSKMLKDLKELSLPE